ncbi:MAG: hypothetical protein MR014_04800 [Oscillospiraceae bacterium]|nr:hypothetical protein [Oscillospiraceae bacterium]
MGCTGCRPENRCRYRVAAYAQRHKVSHCSVCPEYLCGTLLDAFEQTARFEPACRAVCSPEEYDLIDRAFFQKRKNLEAAASL